MEYEVFHKIYESKATCTEKEEDIDKYINCELEDLSSCKLGLINRKSIMEGRKYQRELNRIKEEYEQLLMDINTTNIYEISAITIIPEEKYQFFTVCSSEEVKISDTERNLSLKILNDIERDLKGEKENLSFLHKIFNILFTLLGVVLAIIVILLIIYSYKRGEADDMYGQQKYKLKEEFSLFDKQIYEDNILNKNISYLKGIRSVSYQNTELCNNNNSKKRENITNTENEIISIKEQIIQNRTNIENLEQEKAEDKQKYEETVKLQIDISTDYDICDNVILEIWKLLTHYSSPISDYSHEDLLKYSKLILHWMTYNYLGGTFLIVSGMDFQGISIIWYEAKLIGHFRLPDSNNAGIRITFRVQSHQLIENGDVLVYRLDTAFSNLYFINMSNLLLFHQTTRLLNLCWMNHNSTRPSIIEFIDNKRGQKAQFMEYDYKTSLFSNIITLEINETIKKTIKAIQRPIFIFYVSNYLKEYSTETGLKLQQYNTVFRSLPFIELSNNKLGVLTGETLTILELETLFRIGFLNTTTEIPYDKLYDVFTLSADKNIFLKVYTYLAVIKFDTKTELWRGNMNSYINTVTAAIQVNDNIFVYSDNLGKIWIINLNYNSPILLADLIKYEEKEFNYFHYGLGLSPRIRSISVVERDNSPSRYVIRQI